MLISVHMHDQWWHNFYNISNRHNCYLGPNEKQI